MIMNIDALNCKRLLMLYMSNLTGKRYMMTKRFMDLCEVLRTTALAVPRSSFPETLGIDSVWGRYLIRAC